MNSHEKILKVMDVDAQNLPLDDFKDAEGMVNFYMKKTDEEIDAIYKEYYGEDEEPKMKFIIIGEFEFPRDDVEELVDKTLIHRIEHMDFVPAPLANQIGEQYLADGYDSYIVLDDYDISTIHSPWGKDGYHYWIANASDGGVVVFNSHMEMMVGCWSVDEAEDRYGDKNLVWIENQFREEEDQPVFNWDHFDQDDPYYQQYDKIKKQVEKDAEALKKDHEHKVYMIATDIWDQGTLYQNLYRCNEARQELLDDEMLWKDVILKLMQFMVTATEDATKDPQNMVKLADILAETTIEENNVYAVAHRTVECPIELLYDDELWEMVMSKMIETLNDMADSVYDKKEKVA